MVGNVVWWPSIYGTFFFPLDSITDYLTVGFAPQRRRVVLYLLFCQNQIVKSIRLRKVKKCCCHQRCALDVCSKKSVFQSNKLCQTTFFFFVDIKSNSTLFFSQVVSSFFVPGCFEFCNKIYLTLFKNQLVFYFHFFLMPNY